MNNRKEGNEFETSLANYLSFFGFWAMPVTQGANGQTVDLIASKSGKTYLIDCKRCETHRFPIDHIEDNQVRSIRAFEKSGGEKGLFALWLDKRDIFMVTLDSLLTHSKKSMNLEEARQKGVRLEEWVRCHQ